MGAYSSSVPEGPKPEHPIIEASTVARNLHPNQRAPSTENSTFAARMFTHRGPSRSVMIRKNITGHPYHGSGKTTPIAPIDHERARNYNKLIEFVNHLHRHMRFCEGEYK